MDIEEIRSARLARPFNPFNLVLVDGRELVVDKACYLTISPTRRFVTHSSSERFEGIPVERIRALRFVAAPSGHTIGPDSKAGAA